ncbi:hypothetical protein DFJ74DRAFT_144348 [Hyaloraphidium curvatum]|nr:hypothetical protein DFJ74DRAFT_144348 [Hyaloraphidium curvatum]
MLSRCSNLKAETVRVLKLWIEMARRNVEHHRVWHFETLVPTQVTTVLFGSQPVKDLMVAFSSRCAGLGAVSLSSWDSDDDDIDLEEFAASLPSALLAKVTEAHLVDWPLLLALRSAAPAFAPKEMTLDTAAAWADFDSSAGPVEWDAFGKLDSLRRGIADLEVHCATLVGLDENEFLDLREDLETFPGKLRLRIEIDAPKRNTVESPDVYFDQEVAELAIWRALLAENSLPDNVSIELIVT